MLLQEKDSEIRSGMNLGYTHAFKSHSRSDETVGNFVDTMGNSDDTLGQKYRFYTYVRCSCLMG